MKGSVQLTRISDKGPTYICIILVLSALFLFGFVLVSSTPIVFDPDYRAPFPIQLYFDVAEKVPDKNLIISPTSVTLSLSLAYLGAGGKTASELRDVLQFSAESQKDLAWFIYGNLFSHIQNKTNNDLNISIGNRIFADQKFNIKPSFYELSSLALNTTTELLDFKNGEAAAKEINSWIEEKTNNKIKDIVDSSDFDESTTAVLVNAIYFKAPWTDSFSKSETQKRDFYLTKTKTIQVDMMHKVDTFEVGDWTDIDATAVRIPYANSDVYMLIVIPNDIDGLSAMEEKFKRANHGYLQTTPTKQLVDLSLPKFKIEFEISLVKVLQEMGLKSMFEEADFSNMLDGAYPLKVSDVKHKAFISIDEEGTEAAASTVVEIALARLLLTPKPEPRKITVDHPFMFAIRDPKTVYFAGHVVDF